MGPCRMPAPSQAETDAGRAAELPKGPTSRAGFGSWSRSPSTMDAAVCIDPCKQSRPGSGRKERRSDFLRDPKDGLIGLKPLDLGEPRAARQPAHHRWRRESGIHRHDLELWPQRPEGACKAACCRRARSRRL